MIEFRDIYTIYDNELQVLSGINLEIKDGEFVSIVGSSGAGKSTLLRLMTREILPYKGEVILDGVNIVNLPSKAIPLLRRKIGTIYQDFKLLSNKTAFENVAFAMEVCGIDEKEINNDVPKILGIVGLTEKLTSFPHQITGRERQRLAIARALIHRPRIILADEPTGNLDMLNGHDVLKLLMKINELGTTVILATHNDKIVNSISRRVITMEKGKIVRDQAENGKYAL